MTETMSAAAIEGFGGPEVLRLVTVPRPLRINDEVVVRIAAAGLNPLDAKTRGGRGVAAAVRDFPAVLGHDFSGVVVEAPYEGFPLQPGDAVYGMIPVPRYSGSYAEFASVPSRCIAPKPVGLSHSEAAAVPLAALTAWGLIVEQAKAHERQRILIHAGAGGVGHFAIQFASYFGAHVIATGSARNLEWLRSLGAAEVVDYTTQRFEDELEPVDVVIDLIGNVHDNTGKRSLAVLRTGGLIINVPTGSWDGFAADCAAAGVRGTTFKAAPDAATLAVISRLLEQGSVRVHVDEMFELRNAAAAHQKLEAGHTRGKIVLRINETDSADR
ncbi:NADP-dependent oxidoreductase [Gryllotalpicola ginsengisoli]|uniref:NADP-dependent oxidoreductase n=1 Tax=Gryllotalpicola ginsengisoli TaxID=444608 RepID=UPI0003B308E4|nr:NADP-dependent oxidoreductase [Gryllotalpicola ginsengisoli]